ncbi:MAG: hypothetical protein HY329_16845 [Chloroflexi bacterium]|nr:hypothetical protein [Chloroflexota bacterium]
MFCVRRQRARLGLADAAAGADRHGVGVGAQHGAVLAGRVSRRVLRLTAAQWADSREHYEDEWDDEVDEDCLDELVPDEVRWLRPAPVAKGE